MISVKEIKCSDSKKMDYTRELVKSLEIIYSKETTEKELIEHIKKEIEHDKR